MKLSGFGFAQPDERNRIIDRISHFAINISCLRHWVASGLISMSNIIDRITYFELTSPFRQVSASLNLTKGIELSTVLANLLLIFHAYGIKPYRFE